MLTVGSASDAEGGENEVQVWTRNTLDPEASIHMDGGEACGHHQPYWAAAAAVLLYLNTVDLMGKIHKGQPTNGNVAIGSLLTGYVVFSLIVLCGP